MPHYLYLGRYTGEGCAGIVAEGGSRREADTRRVFEQVGGRLETYLFAFGPDFDFVIVAEMPDTAAALVPPLLASATGTVIVRATPLLSPAELDAVAEKARGASFRGVGSTEAAQSSISP